MNSPNVEITDSEEVINNLLYEVHNLSNENEDQSYDSVVVVATLNVKPESLIPFSERIRQSVESIDPNTAIIFASHKVLDTEYESILNNAGNFGPRAKLVGVTDPSFTFALAYLEGLKVAASMAMKNIVEIDSGGGHLPEQIPDFLNSLKSNQVALGSRFVEGGENTYPGQRQQVSKFGTYLSNWFLGTDLSDATSGFEAFRPEVLNKLFEIMPPEKWLCATKGPFHMYQTEMRAYLTWMLGKNLQELPIKYGMEKQGSELPAGYIAKALVCFGRLAMRRYTDGNKF